MEGTDYQLELYYTAAGKMTKSWLRNRGKDPFLAERRRKIRLDSWLGLIPFGPDASRPSDGPNVPPLYA